MDTPDYSDPKVHYLPGPGDIPVDRVLHFAVQAELRDVVVAGYDADGELYLATSEGDARAVAWILERAARLLHRRIDQQMAEDC